MFNDHLLHKREGLILRVEQENQYFYGEISPLPGFSKETLSQAKQQIIRLLNASPVLSTELFPSVAFGLSSLSYDIKSLQGIISKSDVIPLLQGSNDQILSEYRQLNTPDKIKLKVARQGVSQDVELIAQLIKLNAKLTIRLDANQQWDIQKVTEFFEHIDGQVVDYIEEPTSSHEDNLLLATRYHFSLALDETLQCADFSYAAHPHIKAFVIKPTLIGSHQRIQFFLDLAQKNKLQVSISSSFESIIGLSHLKYIAQQFQPKTDINLGIDTIKQFQSTVLFDANNLDDDVNNLECIWKNY